MIDILITADYEVFGDGSGDARCCMAEPTEQLQAACEAYGAQLSVFFDMAEYWAFEAAEASQQFADPAYRPATLMREQAVRLVQGGHDVQLHLHPQWIDSVYSPEGWRVNMDYFRLTSLPGGLGRIDDPLSIRGLLHRGKRDLESMLRPWASDYECVVFRAGAWCIQPSRDILCALHELGFLADSSVYRGAYIQDPPYAVDFRSTYNAARPWRADPDDIRCAAAAGRVDTVWEMPIFARQLRRIQRPVLGGLRRRTQGGAPGCDGKPVIASVARRTPGSRQTLSALWRYATQRIALPWDFCQLTGDEQWDFFMHAIKEHHQPEEYLPLVMIGHPKGLASAARLRNFLARVTRHRLYASGEVGFTTLRKAARRLAACGAGAHPEITAKHAR